MVTQIIFTKLRHTHLLITLIICFIELGIDHYLQEINDFTASDTTQQPGLPEPFHHYLAYGAAYDWFVKQKDYDSAGQMGLKMEQLKKEMRHYHANDDDTVSVRPLHNRRHFQ